MDTEKQQKTVPDELAGLRLDQALAKMFPDYSRSRLKSWLMNGAVLVGRFNQFPELCIEPIQFVEFPRDDLHQALRHKLALDTKRVPAVPLAGTAVIIKHSSKTPLCGEAFAQAFAEAGAPEHLVQNVVAAQ